MLSIFRVLSPIWLLLAIVAASFAIVPHALGVQPMTKESALGVGGKGKFGIGISTGSVRIFTLYKEVNEKDFVQLSGNLRVDEGYIGILDYCKMFQRAKLFSRVTPYLGAGIITLHQGEKFLIQQFPSTERRVHSGIHLPIGFNFDLPKMPLQFGGEVSPTWIIVPDEVSYVQGFLRARLMF